MSQQTQANFASARSSTSASEPQAHETVLQAVSANDGNMPTDSQNAADRLYREKAHSSTTRSSS